MHGHAVFACYVKFAVELFEQILVKQPNRPAAVMDGEANICANMSSKSNTGIWVQCNLTSGAQRARKKDGVLKN